ncbi:MAG: TetR/AcrR family transcriptional regulator [Actinomycetota bacterium]
METEPAERRGPRSETVETVFTWAFRLLIAEGAHAITANRLHQESGVARTTIYRHWPEPADLLAAMLERATGDQDMPDFVGATRADLTIAMEGLVFRFNERPVRPLFGALVEHSRRDPDAEDLGATYISGVLRSIRRAVSEGIDRGDLKPGDVETLTDELAGPLLVRHVLLGRDVDDADAASAIELFLDRHATTALA